MAISATDSGLVLAVPRKRWLCCCALHIFLSSVLWLFLGSNLPSFCFWSYGDEVQLHFFQRLLRFSVFVASQIFFLLGEAVATHPEDKDAASPAEIFFGILKMAWRTTIGASLDRDAALDAAVQVRKLQTSRDRTLFVFLCAISGSLSAISLTWGFPSHHSVKEVACRGAALGLLYASWHLYMKRTGLIFPVIQRPVFFCFKLGLAKMIKTSFKLALLSVPFTEAAMLILNSSTLAVVGSEKSQQSFMKWELDFMVVAAFTALLWEICHHLVHIVLTRRYRFAPVFGSSAVETSPMEMLLVALEETEKSSVVHYLAVLDLCMLSESNVDAWRLSVLFEETGETYNRVTSACLRPLNMLTMKLAKGLDGASEVLKKGIVNQQMQSLGRTALPPTDKVFQDFQLVTWCATTVSALTARSKTHDRYGVAQLRGCNAAVVSSLLSCFLVVEVYLGRRSSTQTGQIIGVHSIKWTVPSRGPVADLGKKQNFPFPKKSELYRKAYAMADVLHTSLYEIVGTFRKEMILGGPVGTSIVERDWLEKGQPLYGTRELHMQNLRLFLECKI